jgi:ATP-dependent Clp protease ATP-binding subunit ClpC
MTNTLTFNLYFDEPRLKMRTTERLILRLIIYSGYTILSAAAFAFLLSDVGQLFWLGVLIAIFLGDRLLHLGQAERSLLGLNNSKKRLNEQRINIAQYLTPSSLLVIERAVDKALIANSNFFLCLTKFLLENRDVREMLDRLDVPFQEFKQKIDDFLKEKKEKENLPALETFLKKAFEASLLSGERFIEPRGVFVALGFASNNELARIFNLFSISPDDLEDALVFGRFRKKFKWFFHLPSGLGGFAHRPYKIRHRIMNRAWTARPTPALDKYAVDFTDLAREQKVGFLIGHHEEYDRLVDILSRPSKPNALLVGESGSGRETLVSHLAYEIVKDRAPSPLFDKRLVSFSIGNLVSGAAPEEITKRLNKIVEEIASAGNIILYIPDIHNLAKTSGENHLSAADVLMPIIANDLFPVIGATYPREFKALIETQSDFSNAFEVIRVNEISEEEAIRLLTYDSLILERRYKIIISLNAIKQAVVLAHKYFRQKLLPSSAEELLKEALADASQKGDKILQADDIINIVERKTDIPIHKTSKEEAEKLLNLENIIHQRLIAQEEAVKAVSRALREYRSGISRKGGPIAVFLFVGPTGVGKTELSKILAKIQFGSESLMIRFDMSEYQDKQSIFRFIGSPDGKLAGSLTEAVIQKPYSLILLDEFEKAHPDILNLFLQVFDDGRLTDNLGRVVDFTNTIIIATSNAHSDFIKTHIEAHTPFETITEELKKKLTDYFKPELLNRFSNIVVFKTLSLSDIEAIAELQLRDLSRTLEETNGISLVFEESAIKKIAEWGYDPVFGARPLRGVISEKLRSPLAEKILKEEIVKGSAVKVVLENEEIKFITA